MYRKYFVWNFDDGLEQDRKIIEILKKYNMGATFNLNSGLYGEKTYEGRIGNLGMTEMPYEDYQKKKFHLLPYVPHFRIPEEEVKEVYAGFEIASHTLTHKNLKKCTDTEIEREIREDVSNLEKKFGQKITGFAYPYGAVNEKCTQVLKDAGIRYARTVRSDPSFRFPEDPLHMPMTCWHISKKTFDLLDTFVNTDPKDGDMLFVMFAHGYEFDFGTKESSWYKFDKICRFVSSHSDIECVANGEAFRIHEEETK